MGRGVGKGVGEGEEVSPSGSTGVGPVEGMGKVHWRVVQRGRTAGMGTQRRYGFGDGGTGRTSVGNFVILVSAGDGKRRRRCFFLAYRPF